MRRLGPNTIVYVMVAALIVVVLLLTAGCAKPKTGSGAPPDGSIVVQLHVWSIPSSKDVQITITAVAANPGLTGQFYDSDLDVVRPYPVTLFKTTPRRIPIYYPPGAIIAFSASVLMHGKLNESVVCEWTDEAGNVLSMGSDVAEPFSSLPDAEAEATAVCLHATNG